ncbi:MAG: hypothetical protein DRO73_06070 [Candidatus Thorarchaeota archaeon]|nr:MAG: hypothetical protein DRO73_06070 [Candidatus Thorarchaeota archaeon]
MPEDEKEEVPVVSDEDVVEQLLSELGVDEEMRRELVESGRASEDILKVEPAAQVRRRLDMEKSIERVRQSLSQVERSLMTVDAAIGRIERSLVPVVLSFLVSLKGNLVSLRTTVIGRSKRKAKTNLQETFVESVVKPVAEEEFAKIEETLTSGMSAPIMEKLKEISEDLSTSVRAAQEDLAALKASLDDYTQKTVSEVEFLTKELSLKPRVEVPVEVQERIRGLERRVEELTRDLTLAEQKIQNREAEIGELKKRLEQSRELIDSLEGTVASLRAAPSVDASEIADLRQQLKALEASKDVLQEKLNDALEELERARERTKGALAQVAAKELECEDLRTRVDQLEFEVNRYRERLAELDDLKARLASCESGDMARELNRLKSELDRVQAANERLTKEHQAMAEKLAATEARLNRYLDLMHSTDKTKAFMMVEETGQMTLKEIGRSLGVSPAQVMKWAEDFEKLGLVQIVNGETLVLVERGHQDEPTE